MMIVRANVGVKEGMSKAQARAIILSNRIAVMAALLTGVFLLYSMQFSWGFMQEALLVTFITLSLVPVLHSFGVTLISRIILAIAIPLAAMTVMMLARMQQPDLFQYQRSPGIYTVILATAIIPPLVFSSREKLYMIICLGVNVLLFLSIDIALRYYSVLHAFPTVQQYIAGNLALIISYALLIGSVLLLKSIVDTFEESNALLIEDLNTKNEALEKSNRELHELYQNIETQNEEIQAQSEELMQSQESLIMANNEIERQRVELEKQNQFLEKSIDEKNRDLLHTNQQLVMQNNELQQFSYTVSHNMRGPVASIIGLMNIHRLATTQEEQEHIFHLIEQSAYTLETVIRDLNKIVDIRNDRFTLLEEVSLEEEVKLVLQSLKTFTTDHTIDFQQHIVRDKIISIKAYVNSIIYNLISNAIQYRSPDRSLIISISCTHQDEHTIIQVKDNGLGIDLSKYKDDMFKLYKRFHTHTQGKGLGLYLIRQQVEKLSGRIAVESALEEGTTFTIHLPEKVL